MSNLLSPRCDFRFLLLFLFLMPASPVKAHAEIDLDVIYDNGREAPMYRIHSGEGLSRLYVEAGRNRNYSLRIRNKTRRRIGLVIAVDGLNIISGQPSSLASHERMYILEPHEETVYRGWRSAHNRVNRFYFTDSRDAYARAWDDTARTGVIAVAVYHERGQRYREERQRPPHLLEKRYDSHPGTGYGEDIYSPSVRVEFRPLSYPSRRYFVRYEWRENLCRMGVIECGHRHQPGFDDDRLGHRRYRDGYYGDYALPPPRRWRH